MSRAGAHTDGNFYVETWVGDVNKDVSQVNIGDTGVFQVIKVVQGSTHTQNVRVIGSLPQGVGRLAFVRGNPPRREPEWGDPLNNLINGSVQDVSCQIEVIGGGGNERVQCREVQYEDGWNPGVWLYCQQNLPLEVTITVV
jgi:hypothetical protein